MIREQIYNDVTEALGKLDVEFSAEFTVEIPNVSQFGDYSTNAAMLNAKKNRMKPRDLAEKLAEILKRKRSYKDVSVAGPGFINFVLSKRLFHKALEEVHEMGLEYGISDSGKNEKVLIEFISANPTGPLNIVSARAAAFGDTLYRVLKRVGYNPTREFYINDAGNQVDILAESVELRYRELHGENIGEFPMEAYHGDYIKEIAQKLNVAESGKILHLSEHDRLHKMKDFALKEIHQMQVNSLARFGVEFDSWVSEKKLRAQGVVEEVLSYLAEAGCTYEMDEAVWFNSSKFGDEKDRVLMKTDGSITYFVPDIAYHLTKYQRGYTTLIDVLGPDHHGYVPRLRAAIKALKQDEDALEIIFLQQVNLFDQGEKVKMSKRAGKLVTMDDLIDETGKDAARFFFIDRKPNAHLNFDIDLAKKQSSENPVYYCQYAHARICSILRKVKKDKLVSAKQFDTKELKRLERDEEVEIIRKILELPDQLISIAQSREPHRLAAYILDLAGMFHKYYQRVVILNPKAAGMTRARMYLIETLQNVLQICFDLMGINAPEKM